MADIFISYSRKDAAESEAIVKLLEREGFSVAVDREFLQVGDEFRSKIEEELQEAKVVIVLWSQNAIASDFVRDEAGRATRRAVLLQLIIDEMPDTDVPLGFGELQRLRCQWRTRGELADASRDELLAALKRQVAAVEPLGAAVQQLQREVDSKLGSEYEVLGLLGTGRMSVVFNARHRVRGELALKVTPLAGILLLPGFYAEFRSSVEAARQLSHDNILSIYDVKLLDTIACTVTARVNGVSLATCLSRACTRLPLSRIKDIASDIAEALAYAHQCGVFHCSLSPSNILIETAQDRAIVADFGMLRVGSGPDATAARALFLDLRYTSPEQCLGQPASPWSDQYSFGAILYEMLTGKPPFVGNCAYEIMKKHCEEEPRPLAELRPECPPEVAQMVMRLLAKCPSDRYLTTSLLARLVAAWPLAESVPGGRLSERTLGVMQAARVALESYNRCLADPDFFTLFYQRLAQDPTLSPHLQNVNFDRLVGALKRSVRHLLEYARGSEDARRELERVAEAHRRFRLEESQLLRFVDTLVTLAVERDPGAVDPAERDRLRADWLAATESGVRRFAELAQVAPPRVSIVVPRNPAPDGTAQVRSGTGSF